MNRVSLFLIVTAIGFLSMSAVVPNESIDNPVFDLKYEFVNVAVELRLNDIPVMAHNVRGKTASQKPVPELIVDGENSLSLHMRPIEGRDTYSSEAYLNVELVVRAKDAPVNSGKSLIHVYVDPTADESSLLKVGSQLSKNVRTDLHRHSSSETFASAYVSIDSPFPRWVWQDGKNIDSSRENYMSLKDLYLDIYKAHQKRDKDRIFQLYKGAAKEFAEAYHYSDPSHGHRIMNTAGLVDDEDWELGDTVQAFENIDYKLEVFGSGKLAHIVDEDGDSPIAYFSTDGELTHFEKFAFYKNENNKWVMIR